MGVEGPDSAPTDAEKVYSDPASALHSARIALASPSTTVAERAEALWALGRSAYYANQMSEAVQLLREAAQLADDSKTLTEILLTLAPALSKEGNPAEALAILEDMAADLEPEFLGQVRNQRGIILTELGRLPEAMVEMKAALESLEASGDLQRQPRTLLNLGAVASMMGDLAEAERWYGLAREATLATGQEVLAATIEGNLGYVESRRGNYAKALDWYQRAGVGFDGLGDVALLVAVLEVDHARTLLDLGLAADAVAASERAAESATVGGNQMLETQSRLLLAEACIQLGDVRSAERAIVRGAELAERLDQKPWQLRAAHLRSRVGVASDAIEEPDAVAEVREFLEYRWVREAYESAIHRAERLRSSDPAAAARLLVMVENLTIGLDVQSVDRARGAMLLAELDDDGEAAAAAFESALEALADQRDLMGSVEMRATITQRLRPIEEAAMAMALRSDHPAQAVLDVLERTGAVRNSSLDSWDRQGLDRALQAELRSARVGLDEAKLAGEETEADTEAVRRLELKILQHRRTISVEYSGQRTLNRFDEMLPGDTAFVAFALHNGRVMAATWIGERSMLQDLGPVGEIARLARSQRSGLRRLADERRGDPTGEWRRLQQINSLLDSLLLAPLSLDACERVIAAPSPFLPAISWVGLPAFQHRPLTLASTLNSWFSDREQSSIRRISVIGGPGLDAAGQELEKIGDLWGDATTVLPTASCEEATIALDSSDLVHVTAHGSFRTDNPFFSSLLFADGGLALLEMSALSSLPDVVVLNSCDGGAAAKLAAVDATAIGTAAELRRLGSSAVIAPVTVVNDRVSAEFSVLLHSSLAAGRSLDEAMLDVRSLLLGTDDPRAFAVAGAFHLFGGRSTRRSLGVAPQG